MRRRNAVVLNDRIQEITAVLVAVYRLGPEQGEHTGRVGRCLRGAGVIFTVDLVYGFCHGLEVRLRFSPGAIQ